MHIHLIRADITSLKVDAMVNPTESVDETTGGNLLCKFVVHVRAPAVGDLGALRASTLRALERAEELAVGSVAFPAFWPAPADAVACASVMLPATIDFRSRARSVQRVIYTLFGEVTYQAFEHVLKEIEP